MQLSLNTSKNYHLSIRVKADGFSFSVSEGNNIVQKTETIFPEAQETLAQAIARKLADEQVQQYKCSRVRVIVESESTIVPRREFSTTDLDFYYSNVFPPHGPQQQVCYTHLPQLDIVEIFALSNDVRQAVTTLFPDATFTCTSAMVLSRIATFCARQELQDNALFAYVTPRNLFLYSTRGGQLQFANSFPLQHPQDSLYLSLSVWRMLDFNAIKQYFYISGEEGSVEYLATEMQKYVKHVEVMQLHIDE